MSDSKNKYWDLGSLHMEEKPFEEFYKLVNNNKKRVLDVNHYSCDKWKFVKFEVGEEYWIDISEDFMSVVYTKCKITCIRNGVVFYIPEGGTEEDEEHIEEFSVKHGFASPLEITVDLDPEYYEIVDSSGNMKVNYIGKL